MSFDLVGGIRDEEGSNFCMKRGISSFAPPPPPLPPLPRSRPERFVVVPAASRLMRECLLEVTLSGGMYIPAPALPPPAPPLPPLPPFLASTGGGLLRDRYRSGPPPPPPPPPPLREGRSGVRYEALRGGSGVRGQSRDWELESRWEELMLVPGETEVLVSVDEFRDEGMLTGRANRWFLSREEEGKRGMTPALS